MTGQTYGRLTVLSRDTSKTGRGYWICACRCGNQKSIIGQSLRTGNTQSCGCLGIEVRRARASTGAEYGWKRDLYKTWVGMKQRCRNTRDTNYPKYGGRGIKIYDAWDDFLAFESWILENLGDRPEGMTLDRVDNNGNYEPGNLKWSTRGDQAKNRRGVRSNEDLDAVAADRDLWRQRALDLGWTE